MNPSIELRIRTMMRALTEVIIPAIDSQNPLAMEQANLLLGHLQVLNQHQGREKQIEEIEHSALNELSHSLVEVCDGGHTTSAALSTIRELPQGVNTDELAHAIEELVISIGVDGSIPCKRKCKKLVIEHARSSVLRARIWFKSMNFDHNPDVLPSTESLFT